MTLEETLEEIKNTPQLTQEEKHYWFVKAEVGNKEQRTKAVAILQEHYLPLTLKYVNEFCKMFKDQVKSDSDVYSLINDGFVFLSMMLNEFLFDHQENFERYFNSKLKAYLKYESGAQIDIIEEACLLDDDEYKATSLDQQSINSLCYKHLEEEIEHLDSLEQETIRYFYGFYGNKTKTIKETAVHLNESVKNVTKFQRTGIKKLQENLSYDETKTLLYQYKNSRKVIK